MVSFCFGAMNFTNTFKRQWLVIQSFTLSVFTPKEESKTKKKIHFMKESLTAQHDSSKFKQ